MKYLSDDDIRPVGDRLTVQSAEVIEYRIDAVLHMAGTGSETRRSWQRPSSVWRVGSILDGGLALRCHVQPSTRSCISAASVGWTFPTGRI